MIVYIDHQLAGPWGSDKYRYTKGPWVESFPEHGYQGKESPQQIYRAGLPKLGEDFCDASPAQQDERLRAIERTTFFRYCERTPSKVCSAILCTAGTPD